MNASHINDLIFKTSLLPGTVGGDAARAAMSHLQTTWSDTPGNEPSLTEIAQSVDDLIGHLAQLQAFTHGRLAAANQRLLDGVATGNLAEMTDALSEGADIKALCGQALQLALNKENDDYATARWLLQKQYGDRDLATFDGMSALGYSVRACAEQVAQLAKQPTEETGVALPDLFNLGR